jgi:hypothetical protein
LPAGPTDKDRERLSGGESRPTGSVETTIRRLEQGFGSFQELLGVAVCAGAVIGIRGEETPPAMIARHLPTEILHEDLQRPTAHRAFLNEMSAKHETGASVAHPETDELTT